MTTLELSERTKKTGFARLTLIELRKLADTRSGLWLLIVIALAAVGAAVLQLIFAERADLTFSSFYLIGLLPAGVLLPVLGILSMTGEWSQRTALTTFTLVPARGRVLAAKVAAGVLIAVAVTALTAAFAAIVNVVGIALDGDGSWQFTASLAARSLLAQVLFVLMGLGFGALLQNSPLAIVLFFAIPTAWGILGATVKGMQKAVEWLDLSQASAPLTEAAMTNGQWSRLAVAAAIWVVLPLALGAVRVIRREVS